MIHRIRAFLSTRHGLVAVALAIVASAAGVLALAGQAAVAVAVLAFVIAIVSVSVVDGHKKSAILLRDVRRLDVTTRTELRRTIDALEATSGRIELANRDSASDLRVLREQVLVRLDLVDQAIEGVGGRLDADAKRLDELGRSLHATSGRVDDVRNRIETMKASQQAVAAEQRRVARQTWRITNDIVSEVDAALQLHRRLPLDGPVPLLAGWALSARGVLNVVDLVERDRTHLVVECGSGTSTVFIAAALDRLGSGGRVVALEHLPEYAERTKRLLEANGLSDHAEVRVAPLDEVDVDGEACTWYSTDAIEDLYAIDLLLVDGPPEAVGEQARYPALPILLPRLRPGATVILDDARRDDEHAVLERWSSQAPLVPQVSFSADVAILQLGEIDPDDGTGT